MKQLKATRDELALRILELIETPMQRKEIVRTLKRRWPVRTIDYRLDVMAHEGLLSVSTQGKIRGLYAVTAKGRTARYDIAKSETNRRSTDEAEEIEEVKRKLYRHGFKVEPIQGPGKTIQVLRVVVPESLPDVAELRRYLYHRLIERREVDTLEYVMIQALREWCLAWPEAPATLQD